MMFPNPIALPAAARMNWLLDAHRSLPGIPAWCTMLAAPVDAMCLECLTKRALEVVRWGTKEVALLGV